MRKPKTETIVLFSYNYKFVYRKVEKNGNRSIKSNT